MKLAVVKLGLVLTSENVAAWTGGSVAFVGVCIPCAHRLHALSTGQDGK